MSKKNRRIVLIVVLAAFVSILGGVSLYSYLTPQKTTVYVFKDNYESGTTVTKSMLTAVRCDSKIVVAGKNTDTSSKFVTGENLDAVLKTGDSLRMDVSTGMPLTLALLSVNGGSDVEKNMDPKSIAVTVPISDITGVSNDLKNGSRVNIYETAEGGKTVLAFQGMRILSTAKDSSGTLTSATIGKTTLSCELATYLALTSNGRNRYKVCIADFNIDFGDVKNTLNFDPNKACMVFF